MQLFGFSEQLPPTASCTRWRTTHYNQDMVLALGFRVRSPVGVRFRQWANDKLKEYIVKGFVLDDERLKNAGKGRDCFDEHTRRHFDNESEHRRVLGELAHMRCGIEEGRLSFARTYVM